MTWQKCPCEQSEGIDDGQGATYCARCGGHSPNFIAHRFDSGEKAADRILSSVDEEWDEYIYD